jgi:hypothetical protein
LVDEKMVSSIYKHILPRKRVRNNDPIPAKTKKKKKTSASAAKKKMKTTTEYEYPSFKPKYPRMRVSNIWLTTTVCFDCDTNTTSLWRSDPTGSKVISSSLYLLSTLTFGSCKCVIY